MLRGEAELDRGARRAVGLRARRRTEPVERRLQPGDPDRDVRRHHHRRVPPLHLQPVAAGARVLRRLPDRPDRHARASRPSASSTRTWSWSTATSRPWPTASTSTTTSTASAPRSPSAGATVEAGSTSTQFRDRADRARRAGSSSTRTSPTTPTQLDRAVVAKDQIRTVIRTFQRQALHRDLPRPHRGAQDADLRQGRQPRRGHRADRPRGVRQGQRLRQKITYKHRPARSPRT